MNINTTRFGSVQIEADDILLFPCGLIGFEDCRHWVILADAENQAVGWLQSISDAGIAVPVVCPRRFSPNYQVRLKRSELAPLQLPAIDQAYVLCIVGQHEGSLTINLKAPIVINLDFRMGRQVITNDDQPLQYELAPISIQLRKSA